MNILDTLAICMMVTSLAVFGLRSLKLSVIVYGVQTLLLVGIFFTLSSKFNAEQLSTWAVVAFFTKVLFVPAILLWLIKNLGVVHEDEPVGGFFVSPVRNSFIKQILAYCLFENGIHLSLALMAYNSNELVELGILTDAIFAVIIMSVLAIRFYKAYGSLDTSKATNLRG